MHISNRYIKNLDINYVSIVHEICFRIIQAFYTHLGSIRTCAELYTFVYPLSQYKKGYIEDTAIQPNHPVWRQTILHRTVKEALPTSHQQAAQLAATANLESEDDVIGLPAGIIEAYSALGSSTTADDVAEVSSSIPSSSTVADGSVPGGLWSVLESTAGSSHQVLHCCWVCEWQGFIKKTFPTDLQKFEIFRVLQCSTYIHV